jgi:hypothetical protein
MVHQIVGLTKGLQEAKDSGEEARMLRRQRVQMFRGFSAHLMEVTRRLGIKGDKDHTDDPMSFVPIFHSESTRIEIFQ